MNFTICENTGFFLRVALIGPSGSGKTFTALRLATELGYEKVGIIDTENRSARRYARSFKQRFHSLELGHFSPRDYIEAIQVAEKLGIEVLVIDSLSHGWAGKGGVLEMVDQSARRQARGSTPSSFSGWREVTPEHNKLVEALVMAKLHLIVTLRTKTEYVVEKDDKGRAVPRKVGMQPVQRDGLEYEFDIVGDMSPEHDLCLGKSRLSEIEGAVISRPGAELAQKLRAWVDGAIGTTEAPERTPPGRLTPPPRDDDDSDPDAEEGQEATGERRVAQMKAATDDLDAIAPWLEQIAFLKDNGTAEELTALRAKLNEVFPSRARSKVMGEALRKAVIAAEEAIKLRAGTCDPGASDQSAA